MTITQKVIKSSGKKGNKIMNILIWTLIHEWFDGIYNKFLDEGNHA